MKYILILVSLVFMTGCKNENQEVFETKYIGKGEVFISNEVTSDPHLLGITDNYLIIGNRKHSPLLEIYDIKEGRLLKEFLHIGNGPYEALSVNSMQINGNQDFVYVHDVIRRQLLRGKLSQAIGDSVYVPEVVFTEKDAKFSFPSHNFILCADSLLYTDSKTKEGRLRMLDTVNGTDQYYINFPDKKLIDKKLTEDQNAGLYLSSIENNDLGDKIAMATKFAQMIDIFSLRNGEMESVFSYHIDNPSNICILPYGDEIVAAITGRSICRFLKSASTENYFYVLHSGKAVKDQGAFFGSEIYVVNWDGKEHFKITLDQEISAIGVSSDDKILYGINKNMDVVKFRLTRI